MIIINPELFRIDNEPGFPLLSLIRLTPFEGLII